MTDDATHQPMDATEQIPSAGEPGRAQHRRWVWVLISLMATAMLGLGVALVYSNDTSNKWRHRAQATQSDLASTQAERDQLLQERDDLREDVERSQASLANMTERFNEASDRIRSLADEKAQVGDELMHTAQVAALSAQVTEQLDACVEDLQQMQGYLVGFEAYDLDALLSYVKEVNSNCNAAQNNNAKLAELVGTGQ